MDQTSACYCCHGNKPQSVSCSSPTMMDVDSALHELGMLSTVTESRKQFLREREKSQERDLKPRSNPNSPAKGFHVLQMNPQYVTNLLVAPSGGGIVRTARTRGLSVRDRNVSNCAVPVGWQCEGDSTSGPLKCTRRVRSVYRFKKPYEVPWRDCEKTMCDSLVTTKSGSRERNISESEVIELEAPGFVRSKSLDDLQVDLNKLLDSKVEIGNVVRDKKEIDKVSQHLQNLQVK